MERWSLYTLWVGPAETREHTSLCLPVLTCICVCVCVEVGVRIIHPWPGIRRGGSGQNMTRSNDVNGPNPKEEGSCLLLQVVVGWIQAERWRDGQNKTDRGEWRERESLGEG